MRGSASEGLKEKKERKRKKREGASGSGPPGGSRLLLLLSLSNLPALHCIAPSFLFNLSYFLPDMSLTSFSPTINSFAPSSSSPPWSSSPPFFSILALRVRTGCLPAAAAAVEKGRASESLMRCLSPPSRLDRSSQQRTTITHTVVHTLYPASRLPACLPAYCCCCCC